MIPPKVLIETVDGTDVWDNDDDYAEQVLCAHGRVVCEECSLVELEMWK